MPYLHWETDRRRSKFDEIMRTITEEHKKKEAEKIKKRHHILPSRQITQGQDPSPDTDQDGAVNGTSNARPERPCHGGDFRMISTTTELMDAEFRHQIDGHKDSKFANTKVAKQLIPGILKPKSVLGQVLHRAALLHEAMDYYQERELLKAYLHHDPPFHPRRTLDQSYYWTLKTTKKRDRDQVVYRGTAPKKEFRHDGAHVKSGCEQCLSDIRKVPRVVMVDQLWLWILNGSMSCHLTPRHASFRTHMTNEAHRYHHYQLS
jgi:hypothetical protein